MMSVVPVKKKLIVLTALAAVNFMAGLIAALEIHQGFLVLVVGVPIVCGLAMFTVKCPRCGYPAWKREQRAFGVTWTVWGGFTFPNCCANCGRTFQDPSVILGGRSKAVVIQQWLW